ncbi:hypothetical protein [Streptomyces sp. NPDC046942]|uniref:hypothetical protein n=1 Tax=Streptomyces sp. NPDC046942 TaxID=3155137 RepID=UPI0033E2E6D3
MELVEDGFHRGKPSRSAGAFPSYEGLRDLSRVLISTRSAFTRPNPAAPGLPRFDELMTAYAKRLSRDLREPARTQPHVTVEGIAATHAMLLERPEEVAAQILGFTESVGGRGER